MQPGPLGHFRMEPWDMDGYSYGLYSYGILWIWDRLMGYGIWIHSYIWMLCERWFIIPWQLVRYIYHKSKREIRVM